MTYRMRFHGRLATILAISVVVLYHVGLFSIKENLRLLKRTGHQLRQIQPQKRRLHHLLESLFMPTHNHHAKVGINQPNQLVDTSLEAYNLHSIPDAMRRPNASVLTIGDLPGYTGWGRPSSTTAPWYKVLFPRNPAQIGAPYNFQIVCQQSACQDLHAVFYMRAYGPTILTGTVKRKQDDNKRHQEQLSFATMAMTYYEATLLFLEPGTHVLEVVLAFSHVPPIESLPLPVAVANEPAYEGYLIPDMPAILTVNPSPNARRAKLQHSNRTCDLDDLYESSPNSALERATWTVVSRVPSFGSVPSLSEGSDNVTFFAGYTGGSNSIGFRMQYHNLGCDLPPLAKLEEELLSLDDLGNVHIVLIGDSNMIALQKLLWRRFRNHVKCTLITTKDGLHVRMPDIRKDLLKLTTGAKPYVKFYLLLNAGLHDIARLCSQRFVNSRSTNIAIPDEEFSCVEEYQKNLEQLVLMVKAFPFQLRVFQTTTAGWLKWGNYGFNWPASQMQEYPMDSHACHKFNQVAWKIMRRHEISVIDGYWLSLSRPDHREIDEENKRGKKLVHQGVEIYDVLLRKWLALILLQHKNNQGQK